MQTTTEIPISPGLEIVVPALIKELQKQKSGRPILTGGREIGIATPSFMAFDRGDEIVGINYSNLLLFNDGTVAIVANRSGEVGNPDPNYARIFESGSIPIEVSGSTNSDESMTTGAKEVLDAFAQEEEYGVFVEFRSDDEKAKPPDPSWVEGMIKAGLRIDKNNLALDGSEQKARLVKLAEPVINLLV